MKKAKVFETEVALCAAFLADVDAKVWTAYAETAGWDILLHRRSDGFQIGVQAKLRLNLDVVNQSLDSLMDHKYRTEGPDCRALLVPATSGFSNICEYLGLVVISPRYGGSKFWPQLPVERGWPDPSEYWPEWVPMRRHPLPEFVPDVAAGAPSPLQLTTWKVKAIKIAVTLQRRGSVSRADFKHIGIDSRRWIESGWLFVRDGALIVGANMPDFKSQHPRNYVEIDALFDKWARPI